MKDRVTRFALLSHVLPPSVSGQAVMLFRLLSNLPGDAYCLITRGDDSPEANTRATEKLPARHYVLKPKLKIPILHIPFIFEAQFHVLNLLEVIRRGREIAGILSEEKSEILVACTGDLLDLPAAYVASRLTGIPLVAYLFDDYANQWVGASRRFARYLEKIVMKRASNVIVPNEYLERDIRKRHPVRTSIVRNPAGTNHTESSPPLNPTGVIVFTGAVYHVNIAAFHDLLAAMDMCDRPDLSLHIYTWQSKQVLEEQGVKGKRVRYHGHVPAEEVASVHHAASILFVPFSFDSPISQLIRSSAPGKLSDYLASGTPVLAYCPADTFVAWYLTVHNCGVAVTRREPAELAGAINRLMTDGAYRAELAKNGKERARVDFDCVVARENFLAALSR